MKENSFTIRVYGILIDEQERVLVSDEYIYGQKITKFPGGGLNWGEGTKDCLKREFLEELNWDVEVGDHFYTTDFFQPSAFNSSIQVISIYYRVKFVSNKTSPKETARFSNTKFDFVTLQDDEQIFRWVDLNSISPEDFSLSIDQKVCEILHERKAGN